MTGYSKQYRENRLKVLAGNPLCTLCGKRPATQADHIVPRAYGGDDSLDNLRPSCAKCNTSRGARQGNTDRAKMQKARNAAVAAGPARTTTERGGFGARSHDPDRPEGSISQRSRTGTGSGSVAPSRQSGKTRTGSEPGSGPRLVTPMQGGVGYGREIAAWAKTNLQIDLMPWQVLAHNGMTEHDPKSGKWARRLALTSVARQSGKTVALRALVGWWLCEGPRVRGGPQTVISTAHVLDLAVALFQDLAPVLEEYHGAKAKWSYGRNELRMPDGSLWLVRAATPQAGHGRSPDLVVADEIWDIGEEAIEQGLIPAQRARKNPLCAMWSTAGTEASRLMLRYREQGIAAIDAGGEGPLFFAEWSPPPGCDLDDPSNWRWANPALGYTIDLDTLIAESKTPNRAAFLRASLNLWVSSDNPWLQPGLWDALGTDLPERPAHVLAIDSSQDGTRYAGVAAEVHDDGTVVVRSAIQTNSVVTLWDEVRRQLPATATLAYTPPLELGLPPELKGRSVMVGYGELVKWTALVRQMMIEGRLRHRHEQALGDHIARAVAVNTQNGLALSSRKSTGPIELARLTVFAAALCTKPTRQGKPMIAVGGRR